MNKISLIISREYLTRVKKKSFIIMSIVGPMLFAALMVVPALLATMEDKDEKKVAIIDQSSILTTYDATGKAISVFPETEYLKYVVLEDVELETLKENFASTGYYAVLFIPENIVTSERAVIYSNKQPSLDVTSQIENAMENEIENLKLVANDIENLEEILAEIETSIKISSIKWTKDGEAKKSNTGLVMGIGYAAGLMIYMFIFIYGAMVMRGVIEEKVSRIVEVIVSSVKPFQLMMGKIIGVGMVGLTQFLIWIVLTGILVVGAKQFFDITPQQDIPIEQVANNDLFSSQAGESALAIDQSGGNEFINEMMGAFGSLNPGMILASFLFYFVFGFMLYASLFAIVGSAVDNETETQQFMMPITIPLVLGIIIMPSAMNNPEGPLAFWFSMIPFTSPVVMMVRMPFGVPGWQMLLSAAILILTILGAVWVASKIYRVGILMYGKKITYKELGKWLKYKN